jgi:hypothetical protein
VIEFLRLVQKWPKEEAGDSFIMVVKGHGDERGIICSDGKMLKKDDILMELNNKHCSVLAGKPKLILISSCRGGR